MGRIPRDALLANIAKARIVLAPSLFDGVPNLLYETMALGSFPIFSPLETISQVVSGVGHGLFARNLYPMDICDALVKAANDDEYIDMAAARNLELVRTLADRKAIRGKVIDYYLKMTA